MTRTKGYRVKIWKQKDAETAEPPPADADYLTEDGDAKLFATQRAAQDAAEAYARERPEIAFVIEPVVL